MQDKGHTVKSSNIKIIGVPEEGEKGQKQFLKRQDRKFLIAKNFPNFMENTKPRNSMNPEQEKQKPQGTSKISNKENTLKAVRETTSHTEK